MCVLFVCQDLSFILKGLARLLNNPLVQTYLPHSTKKIQFNQELLILFWKFCDFNKVCGARFSVKELEDARWSDFCN